MESGTKSRDDGGVCELTRQRQVRRTTPLPSGLFVAFVEPARYRIHSLNLGSKWVTTDSLPHSVCWAAPLGHAHVHVRTASIYLGCAYTSFCKFVRVFAHS
jgi:hypothetical protein